MKPHVTTAQARAYKARWRKVHQAEVEELRRTSMDVKLHQVAALMASVAALGWAEALSEGDAEVRDRWNRLRKSYRG